MSVRRKTNTALAIDPYSITCKALEGNGLSSLSSTRTESDKSSGAKRKIWSTDVAGRPDFNPEDAYIAHILPAGKLDHEEWFGVAGALLGLDKSESTEKKLMAMRGVHVYREDSEPKMAAKPALEADAKDNKSKTVCFDEGAKEQTKKGRKDRMDHTGLVHAVSNKLRMEGQGTHMDGHTPKMLLIPAMTLEHAKAWRGEAYVAVVLAGLPESPVPSPYQVSSSSAFLKTGFADAKLYLQYKQKRGAIVHPSTTTEQEEHLIKACQLLADAILGLTEYVRGFSSTDLSCLDPKNQVLLKQRAQSIKEETVTPECKDGTSSKPVLIIKFGSQRGAHETGHPAPDPLGLACKAASAWGFMTGTKLLTASEPEDLQNHDDDCSLDRRLFSPYLAQRPGSWATSE
jgi:hypothetical protein